MAAAKDWRVPVAVAHHHKHHLYETCEAYREIGRWSGFLTTRFAVREEPFGLLARSPIPRVSKAARQVLRYHDRRIADNVWIYAPSPARRAGLRLAGAKRFFGGPSFHAAVADWAIRRRTAVHTHTSGAEEIFRRIGPEGLPCLMEMYIGDHAEGQEILRREFESLGMPADDAALARWGFGMEHVEQAAREYDLADLIYCPSPFVADSLLRASVPKEKIVFAPYGAILPASDGVTSVRAPDEPLRIAFVGTEGVRKGLIHLLRAVERMRPHVELHVFGMEGFAIPGHPYSDDGIAFYGYVTKAELMKGLERVHVGCLPSLFEGSAIGIYDLLGAGVPVVVTPNTGTLVTDGVEGLLVPIQDVGALVAAFQRLIEEERTRQAMGRAARELARQCSWARYREETVRPLLERTQEKGGPP